MSAVRSATPGPSNSSRARTSWWWAAAFAFTTLRSLINYMIHEDNRKRFGNITVVYKAPATRVSSSTRTSSRSGKKRTDLNLNVTVDKGDETWKGREGFVPAVCKEVAPSSDNAVAVICGPPIMIRFTLPVFFDLNFSKENILTSLEMRMKCGIGKCGRCNVGHKYVCKDGPVFARRARQAHQRILKKIFSGS